MRERKRDGGGGGGGERERERVSDNHQRYAISVPHYIRQVKCVSLAGP